MSVNEADACRKFIARRECAAGGFQRVHMAVWLPEADNAEALRRNPEAQDESYQPIWRFQATG